MYIVLGNVYSTNILRCQVQYIPSWSKDNGIACYGISLGFKPCSIWNGIDSTFSRHICPEYRRILDLRLLVTGQEAVNETRIYILGCCLGLNHKAITMYGTKFFLHYDLRRMS